MKFKRLEISGFKSFSERSVLDFRDGITAIVGPNGCGKSNISDAIRWVMGEQRAKDLRGASMADVIFAGTQRRSPAQMAEVKLKLESDSFPYPYSEFHEVEVIRRLTMNGVSEYRINGAASRLKDVRGLFMDSGVGTRAMSIIEQGKIHQIVTSRPEDRRGVIEEAAGINKFKESKKEALAKLEDVNNNLLRVQDVTQEVEKQYHYLKKQAAKALQHRELTSRIYELEVQVLSKQYFEASNLLTEALEQSRHVQEQLEEQKKHMAELQEQLQREHQHIAQMEAKLTYHTRQRESFLQEKALLEQKQQSIQESMRQFEDFSSREAGELTELSRLQDALQDEVRHFSSRIDSATNRMEQLRATIAEASEALQRKKEKIESYKEELELARQDSFETLTRITNCRNRLIDMENNIKEAQQELENCRRDQQELEQELGTAQHQHSVVHGEYDALVARQEVARQRLQEAQERKQELESTMDGLRKELGEVRGRKYEVAYQIESARKILQSLQANPPADFQERMIEALHIPDPAFRVPVLSLLGTLALGYLVEKFDGTTPQILTRQQPASPIEGAVPVAQLCQAAPGHHIALPGNLYYAEQASELCRRYPGQIFADASGTVYRDSCCIGSADLSAAQALDVLDNIAHLEEQEQALLKQEDDLTRRLDLSQEQMQQVFAAVQEQQAECARLAPLVEAKAAAIQEQKAIISRVEKHLELMNRERQRIEQRQEESRQQIQSLNEELKEHGNRKQDLEEEIEDLTHSIEHLEPQLEDDQAALGEERVRLARAEEVLQSDRNVLEEKHRKLAEVKQRSQDMLQRLEEHRQRESTSKTELQSIEKRLEEIDTQAIENEEIIARTSRELDEMGGEARQFKDRLASYRDSIEKLEEKEKNLYLVIEKNKLTMENVTRQADEKNIELASLKNPSGSALLMDEQEVLDQLKMLRASLSALGSVNMEAIDTYEEVRERYEFLSQQQEDLQKSVDSIRAGIDKIDQTTKTRFMETFNQVNEKFQLVFPRLFQGGTAYLKLTDSDPLEAGLEIIAEPPGARPKTLNLLSGGQKTLTAAALIFAIFLVKPSPFCFMDEVDAPLDDSNVVRFSSMIKELAQDTQFIIITHNQRTMESADRLYGITMQEPGVSKIVGVDLAHVEQHTQYAPAKG
ncbi:chromosome segregation protein SMC [Desulfurispirillum indicum S5]|uniref:Chromosome partition protein Smc n=1 Tax=Desulfurispirillum indicum (strain ATCC BAA-1389 / DSM 22839 / S5) TaxID=653733 RepID=E6W1M1_DESIS|nr:AAA family ATPase [Desulfurispirillum indicum]ADU66570.1 chromosome segregation protein SMC [Desulfurispirillum indicum S5]